MGLTGAPGGLWVLVPLVLLWVLLTLEGRRRKIRKPHKGT